MQSVPRVAATNNNDVLAFCGYVGAIGVLGVEQALGVCSQKLHSEMHARQFATGDGKVARHGSPSGQQYCVVGLQYFAGICGAVGTIGDMRVGGQKSRLHCAAGRPARSTTPGLSQFHVWNSVHQQPADSIRALIDGDAVSDLVQLICRGQSQQGPEPMMAILFPVRLTGGDGVTQPSAKPLSMIAISMFLMVTAGSVIPKTQAPSQGAGKLGQ